MDERLLAGEGWTAVAFPSPATPGIFPAEQFALNSCAISAACEWWLSTETAFSLHHGPACTGRLCLPSSGVRFPCYAGFSREFRQKSSESAFSLPLYLQDIRGLEEKFPRTSNRELMQRIREFRLANRERPVRIKELSLRRQAEPPFLFCRVAWDMGMDDGVHRECGANWTCTGFVPVF